MRFSPDNRVSITHVRNPRDRGEVALATRKAINMIGGVGAVVKKGDTVLIKPNLVIARSSFSGITTDLAVLEEVGTEVVNRGGVPVFGESSSIGCDQDITSFILGLRRLANRIGAEVVNFDWEPLADFEVPGGVIVKRIRLPRIIQEAKAIINVPKLKTHELTGISVGLKNVLGFLPGRKKQWAHLFNLNQAIVDLNRVIPSDLTIVDGLVGMEGNGPALGTPVKVKTIIAGRNPVYVDEVSCKAVGVGPLSIPHLRLAMEQLPYGRNEIQLVGALKPKRFEMPTRSKLFLFAERMIFTFNYLVFSRLTFGGDLLPVRLRIVRQLPAIQESRCTKCGECWRACPTKAIDQGSLKIELTKCIGCSMCIESCRRNAITTNSKLHVRGIRDFFGWRLGSLPKVNKERCNGCAKCLDQCPACAITIKRKVISLYGVRCIRCLDRFCRMVCERNAIK